MLADLGFLSTHVIRGSGTYRKSRLLRHSLARPGPLWIFVFLDFLAGGEHHFLLVMWTAEICTVLLANVLGRVDVAVFQVEHIFIQRLPHHAHDMIVHVTTPALLVYL